MQPDDDVQSRILEGTRRIKTRGQLSLHGLRADFGVRIPVRPPS